MNNNNNNDGFEYRMSKAMVKTLMAKRKGTDANLSNQKYLCKCVDEEFGIKGHCVRVLTDDAIR